jgi:hypothetical protein
MPKRSDAKMIREKFKERRRDYAQVMQVLENAAARFETARDVPPKHLAKFVVIGLQSIYQNLDHDSDLIEALEKDDRATRKRVEDIRSATLKDLEWLGNEIGGIKGANTKVEKIEKRLEKLNRRLTRQVPRTRNVLDNLLESTKRKGQADAERLRRGLPYIA